MNKKALSFLLALALVLSMLPVSMLTAQEVTAAPAGTEVSIQVTPSASSAQKEAGAENYTLTAELALITSAEFTLGSLQFNAQPKEGITLTHAASAAETAIPVAMEAITDPETGAKTGELKFVWAYTPEAAVSDAIALKANTAYPLGTITMTSASVFTVDDAGITGVIAGEVALNAEDGVTHKLKLTSQKSTSPSAHTHDGWTAWGDDEAEKTSLPDTTGYYYLTDNCTPAAYVDQYTSGKAANITICLNGHTLTSGGHRLFEIIQGSTITLCDCTSTFDADGNLVTTNKVVPGIGAGGVARFRPTTSAVGGLVLDRVVVDGAGVSSNTNNGCVYLTLNRYGELTITDSIIQNCTRDCQSGGSVISTEQGYNALILTNTVFRNNKNTNASGRSIIVAPSNVAKFEVNNCRFENNSCGGDGGALWIASGVANITGCEFVNNTAAKTGGAIYTNGGTLNAANCTFTGNSAAQGSAIRANTNVTLTDCEITGNTATENGAVLNARTAGDRPVQITGTTRITGNTGGDLYMLDGSKLTMNTMADGADVRVATATTATDPDSFLTWGSGAAKTENTCLTYTNTRPYSLISYSEADGFTFQTKQLDVPEDSDSYHTHDEKWTEWDGTTELEDGGKYYLTANATTTNSLINKTVTVCLNGYSLTAQSAKRAFEVCEGSNLTICDCQAQVDAAGNLVSSNRMVPSNAGGSIAVLRRSSNGTDADKSLTMDHVIVDGAGTSGNSNGCRGLLTWSKLNTITLNNCVFRNLQAGTLSTSTYYGGAAISIYSGGKLTAKNVLIEDNSIAEETLGGAALYCSSVNSEIEMTDCRFVNNSGVNGGAIMLKSAAKTTKLTNCDFENNTATVGGAINLAAAATVEITNCNFEGNEATSSGGAISAEFYESESKCNTLKLTGGSFKNNEGVGGGAISIKGKFTAADTEFTKNHSRANGGALWLRGSIVSATATDCSFTENTAAGYGGAISIHSNKIILTGCAFTKNRNTNTSSNGGGAIYGARGIEATDCTFTQNHSNYDGGAIYAAYNSSLKNCTITGNTANHQGGGLYVNSYMSLKGTTKVTDNTADGVQQNLFLTDDSVANNKLIMQVEALAEGAQIGVTSTIADGVTFARSAEETSTYQEGMIFSDVEERYVIVAEGAKTLVLNTIGATTLNLADTALTYDSEEPTTVAKAALGTGVTIPNSYKVGNRRYVAIDTGDAYEIHRVQLTVTAKALRPRNNGVGFKVMFSAAESIEAVDSFGILFEVKNGETVVTSKYEMPLNTTLVNGRELTVVVADYLTAENLAWAEYTVTGTPYIKLGSGEVITVEGTPVQLSFKEMVQYADTNYLSLSQAQQDAITAMCNQEAFKEMFRGWNLTNITIQ